MNSHDVEDDLQRLRELLFSATKSISSEYFLLPVANNNGGDAITQYRERVYAYELYHQLRGMWPSDWPYSLAGEVDKRGHPVVRGKYLDNTKPDLLVHVPRAMDRNLAVIEIKALPDRAARDGRRTFEHDIRKLIAFRSPPANYGGALFLVFGDGIDRVQEYARDWRQEGINLERVQLWHHTAAGCNAELVSWSPESAV